MMYRFKLSLFLVAALLSAPSYGQIITRRRGTSVGRIIAGAVVGGLFALFFLCMCLRMMRRRRASSGLPVGATTGTASHKPLFGGPWGRRNNGTGQGVVPMNSSYQANGQPSSTNYNNYQSPPFHDNHMNNTEYPSQQPAIPPPAYGKEANYNGQYSAPSGPPPQVSGPSAQSTYTPPPGPPPAHTTGKDNTFVGGFRT